MTGLVEGEHRGRGVSADERTPLVDHVPGAGRDRVGRERASDYRRPWGRRRRGRRRRGGRRGRGRRAADGADDCEDQKPHGKQRDKSGDPARGHQAAVLAAVGRGFATDFSVILSMDPRLCLETARCLLGCGPDSPSPGSGNARRALPETPGGHFSMEVAPVCSGEGQIHRRPDDRKARVGGGTRSRT